MRGFHVLNLSFSVNELYFTFNDAHKQLNLIAFSLIICRDNTVDIYNINNKEHQRWDKTSIEAGNHPEEIIWGESSRGWRGGGRGWSVTWRGVSWLLLIFFFMFRNSFVYICAIILYITFCNYFAFKLMMYQVLGLQSSISCKRVIFNIRCIIPVIKSNNVFINIAFKYFIIWIYTI